MLRATVAVTLLFVSFVTATDVRQCTKSRPFPISVDIAGCPKMPCDVIKGTTAIMQVHFVGTRDNIQQISAVVRATTLGITVPYELPEEIADVCSNLMYGALCPIYAGEDVVYSFNFPIDDYYPEISVKVEVSLVDQTTKESVACFVADIKVRKGNGGGGRLALE